MGMILGFLDHYWWLIAVVVLAVLGLAGKVRIRWRS